MKLSTIKQAIRLMREQGSYSKASMAMALHHVKQYRLDMSSIEQINLPNGAMLKALNEQGELMHLHFLSNSKVLPHLMALKD